jgi:CelD/BcsL family acetyltransferase involved in cellulose biosynthesis
MNWRLLPAARFGELADQWRALAALGPAVPMFAPEFVAPLLAHFGSGRELLACCEDGGAPLAMAILAPHGRAGWATFQPPQAPLGLWLQRPGLDTAALLPPLLRRLPGFPLLLGLTQCDPLLQPRPPAERARSIDYIDTARIGIGQPFDAYWAGRGKNLRANLKKQRARLAADGVATRLTVSRAPADMAAAVADFARLEGAGWKARGGTAVGADDAQGRFYRTMLKAFCTRGAGRVYRYWLGDRLAAMDLCIEERDTLVVLKTAYDESLPGSLSPALLMREEATRALFDEGRLARIEFYGKVLEWHLRWTDEVRTLYHVNHYRWPALGRLHALLQARAPGRRPEPNKQNGAIHVS